MLWRNRLGRELALLSEAESFKSHPAIASAAGKLSTQFSGVTIGDAEVVEIADVLADFRQETGASEELIQEALIAANSRLGEIWEEYYHTY